jgi:hypothetical protein
MLTICIFNGEVWELKPKVWDLFSNFTTEKLRAVLFWSPLKDTLTVVRHLRLDIENEILIYENEKNNNYFFYYRAIIKCTK